MVRSWAQRFGVKAVAVTGSGWKLASSFNDIKNLGNWTPGQQDLSFRRSGVIFGAEKVVVCSRKVDAGGAD